jgi:MOSC domain-containing protein YiiM
MNVVESARMLEDYGIEGDRHAVSEGARTKRQVLLIDQETLDNFELNPGQVRENITTSGIDLHSLSEGQRLAIGDEAVVEITGHCAPCGRMDEIREGYSTALEGHRGMLASVIRGGEIAVGHAVKESDGSGT